MASSNTALELFEKYAQLGHQLDETREKRASLQKKVEDTSERLQNYETKDKPALLASTQKANEETLHWKDQAEKDQQALSALQHERDSLMRTRDRLEQESAARREKHRLECHSFLEESRTFQQRHCPQVHLKLSVLFGEASSDVVADKITRLRAVALANGWDAGKLPDDTFEDDTIRARSCQYEELKISSTEEVDWDILDSAFVEEENDDDEIRKMLAEYKEQRDLFEVSKQDFCKAEERLEGEIENKYQACLHRKRRFQDRLQQVTKEVQQLEVDISVTLATQDMVAEEDEDVNSSQRAITSQVPPNTRTGTFTFSPEEGVSNPYQRRTSQPTSGASPCTSSTSRARSVEPRPTPSTMSSAPSMRSNRGRHGKSRKRKSTFGSSMEIGGVEAPRDDARVVRSTPSDAGTNILATMDEDDDDDDELLNFPTFRRKNN